MATKIKLPHGGDEYNLLERVLRKYHARLTSNQLSTEITIALVMAFPPHNADGVVTGPSLKHRGIQAAALTKVVAADWRVLGVEDVVIYLSNEHWENFSGAQRVALLDHELTHIEPVMKDGEVVLDDHMRPKIKLRHHDYDFGWFEEVADRHGVNSVETYQARRFIEASGPTFLREGEELPDIELSFEVQQ